MSVRILFITFYGAIEYVGRIVDAFNELVTISKNDKNISTSRKKLEMIDEFSYLKYKNDENLPQEQICELIVDKITKNKITHIFWFFFPDINVLKDVREKTKTKNVFYNFDDPASFNIFLTRSLQYVDYFINPIKRNEKKYTYILGRPVYTVHMYDDTVFCSDRALNRNILNENTLDSLDPLPFNANEYDDNVIDNVTVTGNVINNIEQTQTQTESQLDLHLSSHMDLHLESQLDLQLDSQLDSQSNSQLGSQLESQMQSDVSILIDDDHSKYDQWEMELLDVYVQKIKNYCIDNDFILTMYGCSYFENLFPDIYVDVVDSLNYFGVNSKLIIILDLRSGLDKGTNRLIERCVKYGVPILSNSNQVNSIVHERGLKIPKSLSSQNKNLLLLTMDNLHVITDTLYKYNQKTNRVQNTNFSIDTRNIDIFNDNAFNDETNNDNNDNHDNDNHDNDNNNDNDKDSKNKPKTLMIWANKILDILLYK